ncbi:SIMPL domain-containing protein [Cohnella ginsengisoli]|uniref:SIMPL domain-containing protein n=1 Tax=Cohnella ginsengisoli TaxID=425004 RepID=A0A9X4QNX0_9BACL|nr:SIMPL domain-containing protein [Cohnella ginsengisoli]MDG0793026.1 SIMPL domain-containing protein [Cohnella ginsengisoli]
MGKRTVQVALLAATMVAAGWFGATKLGADQAMAETTGAVQAASIQNAVTVGAEGSIKVEPDVAYLSFGVDARGKTAQEAQQASAAKFAAVEKALYETYKIDKKDVQTTNFGVQPEYNYTEKEGQVLKGYLATHSVRVAYRDLAGIGKLLDAVSAAGANRVDGVQFGTEKQDQYELEALKKAMTNAGAKASVLATSASRTLGPVINIVQGSAANVPIVTATFDQVKAAASSAAGFSSSVQSGQIEISASVTVQYQLK